MAGRMTAAQLAAENAKMDAAIDADESRARNSAHRKEVAQRTASLAGVGSMADYMAQYADRGGVGRADDALGILAVDKDKESLCGVPIALDSWTFNHDAESDRDFVSVVFVEFSKTGEFVRKGVFNDGSTGIYRQLRELTDRCEAGDAAAKARAYGPLMATQGLRVSIYDPTDEDGEPLLDRDGKPIKNARTYYVAG